MSPRPRPIGRTSEGSGSSSARFVPPLHLARVASPRLGRPEHQRSATRVEVSVAAGYREKLTELVAVPAGVVTETGPVVEPTETVAVIFVADVAVKVADVPLNLTEVAPVTFAPVIVTLHSASCGRYLSSRSRSLPTSAAYWRRLRAAVPNYSIARRKAEEERSSPTLCDSLDNSRVAAEGRAVQDTAPPSFQLADRRPERPIPVPQRFERDMHHVSVCLVVEHLVTPKRLGSSTSISTYPPHPVPYDWWCFTPPPATSPNSPTERTL
jgi:hypothetical protein